MNALHTRLLLHAIGDLLENQWAIAHGQMPQHSSTDQYVRVLDEAELNNKPWVSQHLLRDTLAIDVANKIAAQERDSKPNE